MTGGRENAPSGLRHAVGALVALSLIVAAGTVGLALAGRQDEPPPAAAGLRASALPDGLDRAAAPRIRLRDARGRTVDTRTLRGRPYLVTFVYTRCEDVCPAIGADIAAALRQLGSRAGAVSALFVSVDPRGDTPARAREWLARHSLPSQVRYLLGTPDELRPIWRDWYLLADDRRRLDPVTHAASVWLVDARGRLRARWPGGAGIDPDDVAHDLDALLDRA